MPVLLCCSKITENARKSLASLRREHPRLEPTLAIIQVTTAYMGLVVMDSFSAVSYLKLHRCVVQEVSMFLSKMVAAGNPISLEFKRTRAFSRSK